MKTLPLRWKLALYTGVFASLVLVVFGVGVSWQVYRDDVAEIDHQLREVADSFFHELEQQNRPVAWQDRTFVDRLFPAVPSPYRIEILHHGMVAYRSPNLREQQFPPSAGRRTVTATARFAAVPVRILEVQNREFALRLAADLSTVEKDRRDLLESFLVAGPVALLLVGFGAWWIAGRALQPVAEITAAAQHISAQRFDRRLPLPGTRDEIERLTMVLNEMIDRLETSFLQATRFTADASHELKTPLTIIRGEIENELRMGTGSYSPPQEKLLLNLLEETTRLITISDGLLLLSRADAGKLQIETASLDLSWTIAELLEDMEILAERRGIRIEAEIPTGIFVRANDHFLRQVLLNLFDNAIKYNHADGQLRISVTPGKGTHLVTVANTGPGLTSEQAAKIFDRFFRGDASRDRSIGGHGLGLSICREITHALDGQISVHVDQPGWTEFRLSLPAGSPAVAELIAPTLALLPAVGSTRP